MNIINKTLISESMPLLGGEGHDKRVTFKRRSVIFVYCLNITGRFFD